MPSQTQDRLIEQRQRAIQKIELLPSIPIILQKIIATSSDPNSSAQDLERIIIRDQSISATILKLANSAFYGYSRTVDDVGRAIVIIGFKTAFSIAISVSVLKTLIHAVEGDEFNFMEFWKHTIAAGEAGKLFAQEVEYNGLPRAYVIGLLHDIGKVVLSFIDSRNFDDSIFEARAMKKPLSICEEHFFGFDHQTAGGWLAEQWHLPEGIIAAIRYHHNLEQCPEHLIRDALIGHSANYIVKKVHIGANGEVIEPVLHPLVETIFKILPDTFDRITTKLENQREGIDAFLEAIL
jgi:HD-like signal output (HDOD) protein